MNENTKTLSFVGVAAGLLLAAWMLRPSPVSVEIQDDIGQEFFPAFKDPLAATTMEVVEYDNDSGMLRPFKVTQIDGVWSIPSHENYPADAKNQLEQAAVSVIGLEKLSMVSDSPADHETYGVVDPDANKLEAGTSGIGKRVTLEDKSGNKLAQFIIGKKDPDRPELHFVRVPGQDRVYKAVVKTEKLSTKFQNWIEEDLLKLNAFDIKEVVIDDHSVDELNQAIVQRGMAVVDYDNKDSKWKLVDMKTIDPATREWKEVTVPEDEELDTQKLNDLKTALDDLKIVDVRHKPAGLSKDLRAGAELMADRATRMGLQQRGFYLVPTQEGPELFSNEGEVKCGLNDGVEYVLRFGEIAGRTSSDSDEDKEEGDKAADDKDAAADKGADKKDDATKEKGVDRFIMVTAQFRKDLIPPPELQPLDDAAEESGDKPAETPEAKPADAAPAVEEPKKDSASSKSVQPGDENLLALADDAQPPAAEPSKTEESKAGETKADAQPAAAEPAADKPAEDASAAKKPDAPVDPDAVAEAAEKAQAAKAAERKRIEEDNKRKQDEYDKKVEAGEKRVQELNDRFADWYFVISDATYQKIHIGRDQLLKKKTEPQQGQGTAPVDPDVLKNLLPPK
ncbi:MAG TPA: DUF4340 domain-containing protein [Pirellulales bacterium]|jgi:hypothetical protein